MQLNELHIDKDEYGLFQSLENTEKLEFLWDVQYTSKEASIMKQVNKLHDRYVSEVHRPPIVVEDLNIGPYKLCITYCENRVRLNSNSLRAIKQFVKKLWSDGYMLYQNNSTNKTVIDVHRYLRVYDILGKGLNFSEN